VNSGDSKRGLCHWTVSLYGGSARGTWGESSFTGDPEGYIKEGSGDGNFLPYSSHWGSWKGSSFSGEFGKQERGGSARVPCRKGCFPEDPEGYVKEGSENSYISL